MNSDNDLLRRVFSCIDNTTLNATDTDASVEAFCARTIEMTLSPLASHLPPSTVAAVCVYPRFVRTAARILSGSGIKVASVAGAFPHGQLDISLKVEEARRAVGEGADEVDMVLSRGELLAGHDDIVRDEVAAMKHVCGDRSLKVILETGELGSPENIRRASMLAMEGGADFIKTSTGKSGIGATLEAAGVMLDTIKNYVKIYKKKVGFKAAGGISKPEEALAYAELAKKILGEEYINSQMFRIGASSLTEAVYSLLTF